jgi:(2Fe-2S) ferredoxin
MTERVSSSCPSPARRRCVLVCLHRSCERSGATEVLQAFQKTAPAGVFVSGSDCMGQCASGPTVQVTPDGTWYCQIRPGDVPAIVEQHLWGDRPVEKFLHPRLHPHLDARATPFVSEPAENSSC